MSLLNISYPLLKRALFLMQPEPAHDVSLGMLKSLEKTKLLKLISSKPIHNNPVNIMGLHFPNPVGLAAGLDKTGSCIDAFSQLGFGFVEVGTFTPKAQDGNPQPRLFRLPEHEALINRMGFNNPGITEGIENIQKSKLQSYASRQRVKIGINLGKNKITPNEDAAQDYLIGMRAAYQTADYLVVNLSSPNTPGLRDLQAATATLDLLKNLKAEQKKLAQETGSYTPICFKIAPDLSSEEIKELSEVFLNEELDGLIATNTTLDRTSVSGHKHEQEAGGLSGAILHEKSCSVISAFKQELADKIPIIGVGGISNSKQAEQTLASGAKLIQIYSSFIYQGPQLIHELAQLNLK